MTTTSDFPPPTGDDWVALTESAFDVGAIYEWTVLDRCGAVVLFSGTVRDHAEGRDGVQHLTYEAYAEQVVPRFEAIVSEVRTRWPDTGRIAVLHRVGRLELGESSVITAVSAPHRPQAFEAARFAIDALKESAPIWKHEVWADGSDWGTGAAELRDAAAVDAADWSPAARTDGPEAADGADGASSAGGTDGAPSGERQAGR